MNAVLEMIANFSV